MTNPVDVKVIPTKSGDEISGWDHEIAPSHHKGVLGLKFKNQTSDKKYKIRFWIDPSHCVRFDPNPFASSAWLAWCPRKGRVGGPFRIDSKGDYEVVVENTNEFVGLYRYRLDFLHDVNGTPRKVRWDPIVDNQDGNHFVFAVILRIGLGLATASLAAGAVLHVFRIL
jgi:hypothetical protein